MAFELTLGFRESAWRASGGGVIILLDGGGTTEGRMRDLDGCVPAIDELVDARLHHLRRQGPAGRALARSIFQIAEDLVDALMADSCDVSLVDTLLEAVASKGEHDLASSLTSLLVSTVYLSRRVPSGPRCLRRTESVGPSRRRLGSRRCQMSVWWVSEPRESTHGCPSGRTREGPSPGRLSLPFRGGTCLTMIPGSARRMRRH